MAIYSSDKTGKVKTLKNHPYKLLVLDIDGTLVNADGNISSEDKEALAKVSAAGIQVSLSTGRGVQATLEIIDRLSLDSYHIFCDGALISRPRHNEEVHAWPISKTLVKEMVDYTHLHGIDLELFTSTHYFVERETWSTDAHKKYFGIKCTLVDFNALWKQERIIKGGLVATIPEEIAKAQSFQKQFSNRLHFSYARTPTCPDVDFINILSRGASKGKALEVLTAHLKLELNEVMAVGDGKNDISLLNSAGLAIAMGNAYPEVKTVADHVTLDVAHNGLTAAVNQFLL